MMKRKSKHLNLLLLLPLIAGLLYFVHIKQSSIDEKRDDYQEYVKDVEADAAKRVKKLKILTDSETLYFAVNEKGAIVDLNEFAALKLGYEIDDLVGKPIHSLMKKDFQRRHKRKFDNGVGDAKKPYAHFLHNHKKAYLVHKDGTPIKFNVAITVSPQKGGVAFAWEAASSEVEADTPKTKLK